MTEPKLKDMTIAQLVEEFAAIGVAQDDALGLREISRFNRLYQRKHTIEQELRARNGDQRRALVSLHNHQNMQVRLNAAEATLAVAPRDARRVLEAIVESKHFPQAGDAGMTLLELDRGVFKPT